MKKEDYNKPNPDALDSVVNKISDLKKIVPSDEFIESIENTDDESSNNNNSMVAKPHSENTARI